MKKRKRKIIQEERTFLVFSLCGHFLFPKHKFMWKDHWFQTIEEQWKSATGPAKQILELEKIVKNGVSFLEETVLKTTSLIKLVVKQ